MTLRVGSSFNTAIEAEGFLPCSFCCSKDEGTSCPFAEAHLSRGASSLGCKWGVTALPMPSGAPPPRRPHTLPSSHLHVFKICLWWGLFPCPFDFKLLFSELELLGPKFLVIGRLSPARAPWDPGTGILALWIPLKTLKMIWVLCV